MSVRPDGRLVCDVTMARSSVKRSVADWTIMRPFMTFLEVTNAASTGGRRMAFAATPSHSYRLGNHPGRPNPAFSQSFREIRSSHWRKHFYTSLSLSVQLVTPVQVSGTLHNRKLSAPFRAPERNNPASRHPLIHIFKPDSIRPARDGKIRTCVTLLFRSCFALVSSALPVRCNRSKNIS
jgi:hypothetical protein